MMCEVTNSIHRSIETNLVKVPYQEIICAITDISAYPKVYRQYQQITQEISEHSPNRGLEGDIIFVDKNKKLFHHVAAKQKCDIITWQTIADVLLTSKVAHIELVFQEYK